MTAVAVLVATAGGAGYAPVAPGTAGSIVGLLIFFLLQRQSVVSLVATAGLLTVVGIWSAGVAARHFGREDPGAVVIDEVAGQFLSCVGVATTGIGMFAGFVLFRAFDIAKPWPVRGFERLPGGFGIMADDLMAAVYANMALRLIAIVLPGVI